MVKRIIDFFWKNRLDYSRLPDYANIYHYCHCASGYRVVYRYYMDTDFRYKSGRT